MTRRVLLIDDEELIREVAEISLAKVGGWDVITASSGEEGLGKAIAEQPDAILLDVMMPGLDGPATLERLKADPATSRIPVVFLTAKVRQTEQQQWTDLGVAGVLLQTVRSHAASEPGSRLARLVKVTQWPSIRTAQRK